MGPRFLPPRHLTAPLLLGVALVLGSGCRSESERLFAQAHDALNADDYETAAELFREITISFPGSPAAASAHYELAQIYHLRIRNPVAAEASLSKILSDYPESGLRTSAHRLLGRIYERDLGAPEKAAAHYLEALREPEESVELEREVLLSLGDCYYRLDENDQAVDAYRRALELPYEPASDRAYLRLATLSRLEGDAPAAVGWLRELASRASSPHRRYEAVLGEIQLLIELERFPEADERLREAHARFPDGGDLTELDQRLEEGRLRAASFESEDAELEELQKKIHWGARRGRPQKERP